MKRRNLPVVPVVFLLATAAAVFSQEDLRVLERWMQYTDAPNALYHHLHAEAKGFLESRKNEVEACTTLEAWKARQEKIRGILDRIVGPFPERTPLNTRITGRFRGEGFRLERILYESLPGYYVTAVLLLPEGLQGKAPCVIYCSGHSAEGFRSPVYQNVILNLVHKGFIVFAFDPVGQGERIQYPDPETGQSQIGGPTLEHSYPGAQCFVTGSSAAAYFVRDGVRAVDYLLTRKEVDAARIGITGRSGGGTQSACIAAMDDRIYASAPECYITGFTRLLESIGPQDAEQNFYRGIASGIDHADLLEVRVPKPALMITTSRDFFSIQGARETAREVERAYAAFGKPDRFSMVEDDTVHASTKKNREAMIAFFQHHLGLPGSPEERTFDPLPEEWLRVTERGTASLPESRGMFELNRDFSIPLLEKLDKRRRDPGSHLPQAVADAERLSGYRRPSGAGDVVFTGRIQRGGIAVEKYFMQGEGDYIIPFLYMKPEGTGLPAMICLHPDGKAACAGPGGEMEELARAGYAVAAPDLLGTGEMGPGRFQGDAYNFKPGKASYNTWFLAMQAGRSIAGVHAGDVVRMVKWLETREEIDPARIACMARGNMCSALLHAAAFESAVSGIILIEPMVSYRRLVMSRFYEPVRFLSTVPGALGAYDLPDLAAAIAPRWQAILNPVDQNGGAASPGLINEAYAVVKDAYAGAGAGDRLLMGTGVPPDRILEFLVEGLKGGNQE